MLGRTRGRTSSRVRRRVGVPARRSRGRGRVGRAAWRWAWRGASEVCRSSGGGGCSGGQRLEVVGGLAVGPAGEVLAFVAVVEPGTYEPFDQVGEVLGAYPCPADLGAEAGVAAEVPS